MLNRLEVIGNLGRDPEMNYTPSGKAVTKFSVAINQRRGGAEGERKPEDTLWVNVIAWERLGETCNTYLHKGSKIYVAGRLQVREYETKDGRKGTAIELIASEMVMLDTKPTTAGTFGASGEDEHPSDDIPF